VVELEDKSHEQEVKLQEMQMKLENHIISTNIWKHYKVKEERKQIEKKTLYQYLLDNKQLEEVLTRKSKEIIEGFVSNSSFQLKFLKMRMAKKRNKSQMDQEYITDLREEDLTLEDELGNTNTINTRQLR
jgi:hypothetical protein